MNLHRKFTGRLSGQCLAKLLETGHWQCHDGKVVALPDMELPHLVNALLQALTEGEPKDITAPLAEELTRRGPRACAYAADVASERERRLKRWREEQPCTRPASSSSSRSASRATRARRPTSSKPGR